MSVRVTWRAVAACRDADPELFFPVGTGGQARRQIDAATRICRACPAQARCLAWALDHGVTDGVWGGTTAEDRRALRRLPRRAAPTPEDDDASTGRRPERGEHPVRARAAQAQGPRIRRGAGTRRGSGV